MGFFKPTDGKTTELNEQLDNIVQENEAFKDEIKTDFGNAKTDYFGEEHLNVVDRLNSDFDNVHQRINDASYLEYSGSNITANNTYYGLQKDTVIEGRTLQNVFTIKHLVNITTSSDYDNMIPIECSKVPLLKPSTVYTLIVNVELFKRVEGTDGNFMLNNTNTSIPLAISENLYINSTGIKKFVVTTNSNITDDMLFLRIQNGTSRATIKINNFMLLEGDHTNTPISELPFGEGIYSVGESEVTEEGKYPVRAKSCGKNLLDINKITRGYYLTEQGLENANAANYYTDFIRVHPGLSLYKQFVNSICYYDLYKNFINRSATCRAVDMLEYGFIRWNGIIENLEKEMISTDSTAIYEPYQSTSLEFLLGEPLRSLPNGVCDTIEDLGNGTWKETRRIGKITLNETNSWGVNSAKSNEEILFLHLFTFPAKSLSNNSIPFLSEDIPCVTASFIDDDNNKINCIGMNIERYFQLKIKTSLLSENTLNGFKAYMLENPITVYHELLEPIETIHEAPSLKSFNETTHIFSENYLPATITTKIASNVQAVVMSLKEENKTLNNTISAMSLENEEAELENIETNLEQDVRLTMLELGVI